MSVYAIALINISNRDEYSAYEQGFMRIFDKYQGKLLAVDEKPTIKEGSWPYTRTVLLEFPSNDELDRWYHSDEYQSLARHRFSGSQASIAVVNGLPSPRA
jgi:uncharacterized protein (DUF1330 family)